MLVTSLAESSVLKILTSSMLPKKVKFNALPYAPMVGSLLELLNIPLTEAVA